jgi:CubicO group peptidase (beta-lactamase class C family)
MSARVPFASFIEPAETTLAKVSGWLSRHAGTLNPITRAVGFDLDVESILDALAPRGITSFDFGCGDTLRGCIPSGNGLFTARSLARMYAALAEGGEIDGVRLLSRKTLARATEPQNFSGRRSVIPFDMRWRLGYHGVATTRGMPRRAFGHFGFGGSGAWAEPNRKLAVALIVNSGVGTPFGDLRIWRIGGAALVSADRRSPRPSVHAVGKVGKVGKVGNVGNVGKMRPALAKARARVVSAKRSRSTAPRRARG